MKNILHNALKLVVRQGNLIEYGRPVAGGGRG